ncbi:MAG: hypothetical protein ACR2LS_00765 [Thermomicrobiales bacterium]
MDQLRDLFDLNDNRIWLLVGLCAVTIFTVQAVESAIDGTWPHQRRSTGLVRRARLAQGSWGIVAILVLAGMVLAILNLTIMLWRDEATTDLHRFGIILVAVGWLAFLFANTDRLPFRQFVAGLGLTAPTALGLLLIAGDTLLLIAFLAILPSWDTIRDALPPG